MAIARAVPGFFVGLGLENSETFFQGFPHVGQKDKSLNEKSFPQCPQKTIGL
jgi:hypothetical protein